MQAIHVKNILDRIKDHDFRGYRIPDNVSRMWIYEPDPIGRLKYMMAIGPAKQSGEISDLRGLGNREFNENPHGGSYAYEILQVYELANPVRKARIISNGWFKAPPAKYNYVRPAVIDQLMANLTHSLFKTPSNTIPRISNSLSTESQEAAEQLQSTMLQFTQQVPSTPAECEPPRPSQATTVALSQYPISSPSRKPSVKSSPHQPVTVLDSQDAFETRIPDSPVRPDQHRSSSFSQSLTYPPPQESYTPRSTDARDTPVPLTLASSQILTMSQMLPESLMEDSIQPPPLFIEDSDLEEE